MNLRRTGEPAASRLKAKASAKKPGTAIGCRGMNMNLVMISIPPGGPGKRSNSLFCE